VTNRSLLFGGQGSAIEFTNQFVVHIDHVMTGGKSAQTNRFGERFDHLDADLIRVDNRVDIDVYSVFFIRWIDCDAQLVAGRGQAADELQVDLNRVTL